MTQVADRTRYDRAPPVASPSRPYVHCDPESAISLSRSTLGAGGGKASAPPAGRGGLAAPAGGAERRLGEQVCDPIAIGGPVFTGNVHLWVPVKIRHRRRDRRRAVAGRLRLGGLPLASSAPPASSPKSASPPPTIATAALSAAGLTSNEGVRRSPTAGARELPCSAREGVPARSDLGDQAPIAPVHAGYCRALQGVQCLCSKAAGVAKWRSAARRASRACHPRRLTGISAPA